MQEANEPVAAPGPSRRHLKLAPVSELKAKLGSLSAVVPLGPELIVVSGGVVSIVKERDAGVGSTLWTGSLAWTWNV